MTTAVDTIAKHRSPHDPHAMAALSTARSNFPGRRRLVVPTLIPGPIDGFDPADPYIRRFWVAAIGPGAVEDLLRLVVAGRKSKPIPEPLYLSALIIEGLVVARGLSIAVPDPIPPLGPVSRRRLRGSLKAEHARFILERASVHKS